MATTDKKPGNNYIIAFSVLLAGLLVAGGIILGDKDAKKAADNENQIVQTDPNAPALSIRKVTEDDKIVGNLDADLIVVEYSDIECPFCKQFHKTMNTLMEGSLRTEGKVAWVYRHFPLDQLHSKARREAHATECAYELGGNEAFWNFTNTLYEVTPSNNGFDLSKLGEIAAQVGLDVASFNECQESNRHSDAVAADVSDARKAGGRGTPHNIILVQSTGDLYPIPGALPLELMTSVLTTILAGVESGDTYENILAQINAQF